MQEGETLVVEVVFKPTELKSYQQDIIITCDNGTCHELKIVGEAQLPLLEIVDDENSIERSSLLFADEFKDQSSNKLVKFPILNPNVYTKKKIKIQNKS